MRAGALRHSVRIEAQDYVCDVSGEVVQDPVTGEVKRIWREVATVPASIEYLSARELIAAQTTQSKVLARIVIRYKDGLDASMRIVHKGKIYKPAGLIPDPKSMREYITIPVQDGTNIEVE